jgi:hypothetical protein
MVRGRDLPSEMRRVVRTRFAIAGLALVSLALVFLVERTVEGVLGITLVVVIGIPSLWVMFFGAARADARRRGVVASPARRATLLLIFWVCVTGFWGVIFWAMQGR